MPSFPCFQCGMARFPSNAALLIASANMHIVVSAAVNMCFLFLFKWALQVLSGLFLHLSMTNHSMIAAGQCHIHAIAPNCSQLLSGEA